MDSGARGQRGAAVNQWDLVGRKGGTVSVGGRYEDVYVRTPAGWRFKRREFLPSRSGPQPTTARAGAAAGNKTSGRPAAIAEPKGRGDSALSAMDYLEIEQLVSTYGHALDSGFGTDDNGAAYEGLLARRRHFLQSRPPLSGRAIA